MKKHLLAASVLLAGFTASAQEVQFEEYDLDNGLHVILHQDNTAPVVTTSVMYEVGGKDGDRERTGFAHFFEHLLFEGTKNIERGSWFKIVSSNGGTNNATTSLDRTYYYEVFPSNNLQLGLWMESERMLHPVIDTVGVNTQNEVVKEERRQSYDNRPYAGILEAIQKNLFVKHPYKDPNVGYMDHLDAATLEEFLAFKEKYYVPNNAVLVVAGDFETASTKKMIKDYFEAVPRGKDVERNYPVETDITEAIKAKAYDSNIQIPALVNGYRTPGFASRDARVLDMISSYLSDGKSSKLYKRLVDEKKMALAVQAINLGLQDYSMYILFALPQGENTMADLQKEIDDEIVKLQTELISDRDYQKLQNKFENRFVSSNSSVEGIASSLATYYMLYDDVNLINTEIDIYRSITPQEIMSVAKKYLKPNARVELEYLPESAKEN
ncbi:M16 family metallopeptidase [Spongiivirga citrea]|uniref:Insulinase family protein n=1 Tax=Spongiivirga citrea TaxID=1481457 RepID=A0A6M0CGS9_9FLAO|nr:pitrilysin family protein [Spongiivirga citrea]NER17025.1 insulinase family protein [Spongiivirga citrea]